MARDEYNNVEITNDKQLSRVEFGKTQASEFTSKKENAIPEGDLNEKYIGKTIKKETEVNVDYINKVPTHATQTVVTSSSTASTAGAVTATTAVAASTVAVVAIATVTGISVALHDYKYEFQSLIISSNELRYELLVYDANISEEEYWRSFEEQDREPAYEEEYSESSSAPFKLRVFNKNYDATQYIWGYSTNYGVFDHLVLGDTYSIVLSENTYGGEEIFKDTFTTYVNTSVTEFTIWDNTDYRLGTIDYYLDFIDDENLISDFILEFFEPENPNETFASFSLEKESGNRTLSVLDEKGYPIIELDKEWGYRLSYMTGNEKKLVKEGKANFHDYYGRKSQFNSFTLDREANFIDNSIYVTIDYEDGLGWYDDFKLELTLIPGDDGQSGSSGDEPQYYSQEIPLQSTSSTQTISLNEYEIYVRDSYFTYTYRLSCTYRGEPMILDEETTPFSFTDMSGASAEFYGFEFKKEANFLDNTFKVRLSYKDDFDTLYGFTLHLFPEGVNAQYDFTLEKTNLEQTCTFNENDHWMFSFDYTYTYYLTYWNESEEVTYGDGTEEFVFTDISGGVSEFRGIDFDGTFDINTGMAQVQLDYQDDFNYLDDFTLHLFGPIVDQGNGDFGPFRANENPSVNIEDYPYEIGLEKTTEVQYFNVNEYGMELGESKYIYALTYTYRGEEQDPVEGNKQIEFFDPDALSEVRGINFAPDNEHPEANFNTRQFEVQLDFQDDYSYFSQFSLQVWDDANGGWVEKELEKTTEPQVVTIDEFDYNKSKYPVDIAEGDLSYNLVYVSEETGDPATQYFFEESQPISFSNSLKSEFYGLETSYDITTTDNGECRLPFRFDCVNDAEYFSAPELYLTPVNDEENVIASFSFANEVMDDDWQYGTFSPYGDFTLEELTDGTEYNVMVACYEKDGYNGAEQRVTHSVGNHAFTLNQKQEIYGVSVSNYIVAGDWQLYMSLICNGNNDLFSDGELIITTAEEETYTYDLEFVEFPSVYLTSPKEDTLSEDELDAIFANPVSVSVRYCKLTEKQDGTGYDKSEPITLNCLTSYQFNVSH